MGKNSVVDELIIWLNNRPDWIKKTINTTLEEGKVLKESEIEKLAKSCTKEANSKKGETKINEEYFKNYFSPSLDKGKIILKSISDVKGINDLNPKSPLDFKDKNLSIIYGRTGSGKSGYVRILKQACGARRSEELLCNVFTGRTNQECTFVIVKDDDEKKIVWKPKNKIEKDLRTIDIFDSSCGISYVIDENEVSYEPPLLRFLTYLTELSAKVTEIIAKELNELNPNLPQINSKYSETQLYKKYQDLNFKEGYNKKFKNLKWDESKEEKLTELNVGLVNSGNQSLISSFQNKVINIERIILKIKSTQSGLTLAKYREIKKLKSLIAKKETEVSNIAKVLEGQVVDGISSDLWRDLWEAAREFSNKEAFPEDSFPNVSENSKCVLCQQDLSEEAKKRMSSLEDFVRDKKNEELEKLKNKLRDKISLMPQFWEEELRDQFIAQSKLDNKLINRISKKLEELQNRKDSIISSNKESDVLKITKDSLIFELSKELKTTKSQLEKLLGSKTDKGIQKLQKQIDELELEKWIVDNKSSIVKSLKDSKRQNELNNAKSLCSTKAYSIKKSSLAELLVSKEFIDRFQKELKRLGADDLKVTIEKTRTTIGKVFHSIKLKDTIISEKIENVLSDGEFRIVSLAAFLADVSDKEFDSPFIFDDPISSLDVDYEEKTVKRLIELSKSRQVIVFTHRLSLLGLLNDEANAQGVQVNNVSVVSEIWGKGQPTLSLLDVQKPDKALNTLLNDRLPKAVKTINTEGTNEYMLIAKAICSDFRIIIERIIEDILLNKIVVRYRRGLITKNNLDVLVKINEQDVVLIENMMTKYSIYEHSQSPELPTKPIKPEELKEDLEKVKNWIDEFKKRKVTTANTVYN